MDNTNFYLPWAHGNNNVALHPNTALQLELAESRCSAPCVYETVILPTARTTNSIFPTLAQSFSADPEIINGQRTIVKNVVREGPLLPLPVLSELDILHDSLSNIRDDDGFRAKYGYIDFDRVSFLNEIPVAMVLLVMYNVGSPFFSLLSPLVGVLLAYILIIVRGAQVSFSTFISVITTRLSWLVNIKKLFSSEHSMYTRVKVVLTAALYCFSIYQNIRSCRSFIRNYSNVHNTLSALITVTDAVSNALIRVKKLISPSIQSQEYWDLCQHMVGPAQQLSDHIRDSLPLKITNPTTIPLALRLFYQFRHSQPLIISTNWLLGIGALFDVYGGLARGWGAGELGACVPCESFEKAFVRGLRHPSIGPDCVLNNVNLRRSSVLTGRNGSGKTTLAKSLAIAAVLGSQFGLAPCQKAQLPPLHTIRCEMNVPDTNERDSLFEAEGRRCLELIETIKSVPKGHHLCIFDELFSGTNAEEALDAATGVLHSMASQYKVRFLVTTHMHGLGPRLGERVAQSLTMEYDSGKATHRMQSGITSTSGARDTLVRLGFTDEQLGTAIRS
jgi:hypothetical protein